MKSEYDVVVVGLGAMGSATLLQLAHRGARVLGIDQYTPPHTLVSTQGRTRIIREAYFEHPAYVPFIRRAYELWDETSRAARTELFLQTGGLMIGPPEGVIVSGALRSAKEHDVDHELLDAAEVRRRFPELTPSDAMIALLEKRAGLLFPEKCVEAHLRLAREEGARIALGTEVALWRTHPDGVEVETTDGTLYNGARVVIAAGPWAPKLVGEEALPLEVERQLFHWFSPLRDADFAPEKCPIALWEDPGGILFASFPDLGDGVKAGIHHDGAITDVDSVDRTPRDDDELAMRALLEKYLPRANGPLRDAAVCLYTNTPDHHFIIDYLDEHERVVLASPCSGHGFKFASAVGEVVADLALGMQPSLDISLFSIKRFNALT
jgi:sarcosine oxidase